jgi:hypothetical protein
MKRYALYPGVGRTSPEAKPKYITGRELAICYRVPYSECLDTSIPAIKKVMSASKGLIYLTHLLPKGNGCYKLPSLVQNKIILAKSLHEQVDTSG